MKQLPVWNTFKESAVFTASNWRVLGKLLLIPLILLAGSAILENYFINTDSPIQWISWTAMLKKLISVFSFCLWAPQWIRCYVAPSTKIHFFQFQALEWKFFRYSFFVFIFLIGPIILLGIGLVPFLPYGKEFAMNFSTARLLICLAPLTVGLWLITKILARFSFLWPSLVCSDSTKLKRVWEQTEPYQRKLMCIQSFVTILVVFWVKFKNPITSVPLILAGTFLDAVILIYFTKFYQDSKKRRKSK